MSRIRLPSTRTAGSRTRTGSAVSPRRSSWTPTAFFATGSTASRPPRARRPARANSSLSGVAEAVIPPSGRSGRRAAGPHRPHREHGERTDRKRAAVSTAARSPTARRREAVRDRLERAGSSSRGYAMPPRKSSTRNSALDAARFASARNVPAISMPMPANAIVPSSRRASAAAPARSPHPSTTAVPARAELEDLEHEHVRGLRGQETAARQRRRTEPLSAPRSGARSRWRCRGRPSRWP